MAMATLKMAMALVVVAASLGGKQKTAAAAGAQVLHHVHVVGGDRGWDPSSDVASWSSGRSFRVGDKICKLLLCLLQLKYTSFIIINGKKKHYN